MTLNLGASPKYWHQSAMAEQLKSSLPQSYASTLRDDAVRRLSRSPHPYHKQKSELPYASERFSSSGSPNIAFWPAGIQDDEEQESQTTISERYRESTNSDSGTEADDEHFLKGLPAPRLRPPKGLRGIDGSLSGTSTPLLSSAIVDDVGYGRLQSSIKRALSHEDLNERDVRKAVESFRHGRRIEIVRRVTESSILGFVGIILCFNPEVRELVSLWKKGNALECCIADRANCSRTLLPSARHNIAYYCLSITVITIHKSSTSMEFAITPGNSCQLRSSITALPANNHHIRLLIDIPPQPRRSLARHNTVYILTPQGADTICWGPGRIQYHALGVVFYTTSLF